MPLTVREVLLVLRAKDQASRVIADVGRSFTSVSDEAEAAARRQIHAGQALLGVGVAMTAIGAAGIAFFGSMTDDAVEFDRQAALTLTQVDQLGVGIDQIKDIAKDVGSNIAAPFDQMQTALYDIFSSTNANLPQAQALLTQFAKDAVAGQVDIQSAARGTIGIMNAFQIPLEDVTRVSDVMFQLVRKGVGTYDEFASTIGRAVPSTVRAGQSIETLAGMLAFLTRDGLSTAMASASAARALDSFSNPKVLERLEKMGIRMRDNKGQFRDMGGVVTDLAKKMEGLTDPQRASFLADLFKGAGGTIQARRFWDVALKNPEALNAFIDNMNNAGGAAQDAYNIIFDQPATKMQLLKNNWEILKTEIGDIVIPIFTRLVDVGVKVVKFFRDLSPETKKIIVFGSLIASAFLIIFGVLTAFAGALLLLNGALGLVGLSLGAVLAPFLLFLGIAIALGIALYELYTHSEEFRKFVDGIWQGIQRIVDTFKAEGIKGVISLFWNTFKSDFMAGFETFKTDFKRGWDEWPQDFKIGLGIVLPEIGKWFTDTLWPAFADWAIKIKWGDIGQTIGMGVLKGLWWIVEHLWEVMAGIGDWIGDHAEDIFQLGLNLAGHIVEGFWNGIKDIPILGDILGGVESGLRNILSFGTGNPFQTNPDAGMGGSVAAAIANGGGIPTVGGIPVGPGGYTDSTIYDIHDNNFEVADFTDVLNQLEQQARLNNKAAGAALPANTPYRAPRAAVAGASVGAAVGTASAPRPDARTGPR